jgi:hypothetical protein
LNQIILPETKNIFVEQVGKRRAKNSWTLLAVFCSASNYLCYQKTAVIMSPFQNHTTGETKYFHEP